MTDHAAQPASTPVVERGRLAATRSARAGRSARRRRCVGLVMLVAGGLIVLAAAWLTVTALLAKSELQTVRADVHRLRVQIKDGDLTAARRSAQDIRRHASRAHSLTGGPLWSLAASVPGLDAPARTVRGITAQIDTIGRSALPELVSAADALDPVTLRRPDGSIAIDRIAAVSPGLTQAAHTMTSATASIGALPASTGISSLDNARRDLLTQLRALDRTVNSAALAARIVPPMLGQDGVKRYFVAFQNEAEARGTGGLPGAFAIVEATHGTIRFTRFENDDAIRNTPTSVDFGPAYRQLYDGAKTTSLYVNTNLSPHFPYAAQIWAAMWAKHSGQHVDGAIAVDPTALSYLLAVTGPARLADGTVVDAANVVALTQSTVYAKFPSATARDQLARKAYLLDIASAASHKVLDARGDITALVKAAGRAAGERRLLVYSGQPAVEQDLSATAVSGIVPVSVAPYVGLSIVNDGGNKLDYYLDRSLTWTRTGCDFTRTVIVTIKLTNNAPRSGLSPYVTARSDRHSYPVKPGDNRLDVSYLASSGALMQAVTVDGVAATAGSGEQSGHPLYTIDLELPAGATRTIELRLLEPAGVGAPAVLRQPLVRPLSVSLDDARCG